MGISTRKQREKEELRVKILEAAIELIIKSGYENLTMRKIATKIDYSATTIYSYFKDKNDLITNIAEMGHEIFKERLAQKLQPADKSPFLKIKIVISTFIDMALEFPEQYRVSFLTLLGEENTITTKIMQQPPSIHNEALEFVTLHLKECIKMKLCRNIDIGATAQILFAQIHGLASLLIFRPSLSQKQVESLVNSLYQTFINGIKGN